MTGSRGPTPKRSDQRRRENVPDVEIRHAVAASDVEVPEADPEWHPIAAMWFGSLGKSGQSVFYEPSDWATAWLIAESISREMFTSEPITASALAAWLKGMAVLMVTEGDRRRARIELQRPEPASREDHADVSELDEYRRRFGTN
jgi:hypothetical protein